MTWFAGNQTSYANALNTADIATLLNGGLILSTIADITNSTTGDQYASLSFSLTIPSTTLVIGAAVTFYVYPLNEDGVTYGDGIVTPTSGKVAFISSEQPWAYNAPIIGSAVTKVVGTIKRIVLPASNFRFVMANNLGVTITSGTAQYFSYNS